MENEQHLDATLKEAGLPEEDIDFILNNRIVAERAAKVLRQICKDLRQHLTEMPTFPSLGWKKEIPTADEITRAIAEVRSAGKRLNHFTVGLHLGYRTSAAFTQVLNKHSELRDAYNTARDNRSAAAS